MTLRKKPFENIVGKGENAGKQHFLLCQQCFLPIPNLPIYPCFLPIPNQITIFQSHLSSANAFNLDQSKIVMFGRVEG